ncbi:MAG: phosphodiester glycosidase family protein [Planctomycetota bacterium]|nr:phosphodiester glycosidase family protein [Planctomycetota bacterium]
MNQIFLGISRHAGLVLVAAVMFTAPARAAITVGSWDEIFSGIDHATGYADSAEPRLQKVNCLRIDLSSNIEFFATPHNGSDETMTEKTGDFLMSNDLQVAINANFFSPWSSSWEYSYETNPLGAVVSQGNVVSPSQSAYEELKISQTNTAWFNTSPPASLDDAWTAVAGHPVLVLDGVVQPSAGGDAHPRTAVGISQNDRYLYMMTIDGRQTGVSEGATYKETADWLVRFGSYNGLNLDGGGSTTMAMDDGQGGYDLLNVPVGRNSIPGAERWNGSNIGVRVVPIAGDANLDGMVNVSDATILAANWQRMGDATWSDGDFNGDGNVNDFDATVMATNWQAGVSATATVPEPSVLVILACAGFCLLACRRGACKMD